MIKAQSIYCKLPKVWKGVHSTMEKIAPAKIAIPPRDGVLILWELLSFGSSNNRFCLAKLMIEGIAK